MVGVWLTYPFRILDISFGYFNHTSRILQGYNNSVIIQNFIRIQKAYIIHSVFTHCICITIPNFIFVANKVMHPDPVFSDGAILNICCPISNGKNRTTVSRTDVSDRKRVCWKLVQAQLRNEHIRSRASRLFGDKAALNTSN